MSDGKHAQIKCSIWEDPQFVNLPPGAQRLYFYLISQRKRTMIGLLPYTPSVWARGSSTLTVAEIEQALDALNEASFVIIDTDTCELLVRTVVKHDPPRGSKSFTAAWRSFKEIQSVEISHVVYDMMPDESKSNPDHVKPLENGAFSERRNAPSHGPESKTGSHLPPSTYHRPPPSALIVVDDLADYEQNKQTTALAVVGEVEVINHNAARLCEELADSIKARGSKRPTVTGAWISDMDKLIRIDGRTESEISGVITWLTRATDEPSRFWAPNIRSPKKLREKWDQMKEQYNQRRSPANKQAPGMDLLSKIISGEVEINVGGAA
jgi:hypothetical protein